MIDEEALELTKKLVEIKSVNGTSGERDIALFIEDYFKGLSYFKSHPENIIINNIPDDKLDRRSVIVIVEGTKQRYQPSSKVPTVLLNGHIDTVGIEDFGALREYATKPDELKEKLKSVPLPDEVKKDLESGEYLFGRGASDMKSGDAVFMVLMKRFSEHPENLNGNIVASFNPVEENAHTGIITSLPVFKELRDERCFDFICAINNDFTTKLYENDDKISIYTGMGGKTLPCFYIRGRETHVGQCFEGLDASLIASKLIDKVSFNTDFADFSKGEMAPPPTVLKIKDLKDFYNVQTSKEVFLYFNYFVFEKSVDDIAEELCNAAKNAVSDAIKVSRKNQEEFDKINHLPFAPKNFDVKVMKYDELFKAAIGETKSSNDKFYRKLSEIEAEEAKNGTDIREMPIALIRYLLSEANITEPVIVLYFAPPYVPHCCLKYYDSEEENTDKNSDMVKAIGSKKTKSNTNAPKTETVNKKHQIIFDTLKATLKDVSDINDVDFRILHYYPSLSDSSYLSLDDDEASIKTLVDNFPQSGSTLNVPLDMIKNLSIPTLNIGDFGIDAHKWTERVNIPYTFGILPDLEQRLVLSLLEQFS